MSDFGDMGITEAQMDMLGSANRFAREKSPMDKVRALLTAPLGYDAALWEEIGALGWLGIAIPEDFGGLGLTLTEVVPAAEQLGRFMMATPFIPTTLAAQAILLGGTPAQKSEYLPQIAAGAIATLALSEPEPSWDLTRICARAIPDAGGYRLSGDKILTEYALSAAFIVISVNLDHVPALAIVPRASIPDSALTREIVIDETKRSYALNLDRILIGPDQIMDLGKTPKTLAHIHLTASLLNAAEMTGGAQAVIDYTIDYLTTRKQFGKLIGSYQALKHPMVDAFVEYENARSLLYAAAFSFGEQGKGEVAARMAKVQAQNALSFAADRSIQFHGGFGFTYDCDAQLYRRRAIWGASQFGDAAYHKQKLAELLLG